MADLTQTQTQERAHKRAQTLRTLVRERGLTEVLATTEELWTDGQHPREIRIRSCYIKNEEIPHVDLWSSSRLPPLPFEFQVDERKRPAEHILPPMARLLVPQGVAMQFHLTALLVAHCQALPGRTWESSIPLNRKNSESLTWLDLLVAPAKPGRASTQASSYKENKVRQFRSALGLLAQRRLVDLGIPGSKGRYDSFKLLEEDAKSSAAGVSEYRVPRSDETTLGIPFSFFTRGWVHVLTKSEIAAYFMWRHLGAESKATTASWKERAGLFGLSRDVYDTTQALEAYGLVKIDRPRERRGNGTWRGFNRGSTPFSNKVRINYLGLQKPAHIAVESALRKTAALGTWSRPL